jgi:hypothetical protein
MDGPGPPVPYPLTLHIDKIVHDVNHRLVLSKTMVYDQHLLSKKKYVWQSLKGGQGGGHLCLMEHGLFFCNFDSAILGALKLFGPHCISYYYIQYFKLCRENMKKLLI